MTTAESADKRRADRASAVDEAYQTLDEYYINRRRVVFFRNNQTHQGGFGIVRQAHLYTDPYVPTWIASRLYGQPQVVAVKGIRMSAMDDQSDLKRAFTKEVLVWSRLKGHPGISTFLGFCADFERKEAWLISTWEPYGNVSEFMKGRDLEVPEKLSLVYDTIDALAFLHQLDPPVCHGDIKSPNVLVNMECRAVLCDFGLARLEEDLGFSRLESTVVAKGSIRWCSPELFEGQPRTASSDIFAWAWLAWEIMTGELPYGEAVAEFVIMRKIFEGPLPHANGESRLGECLQLWELMTRCWALDPLQRPTGAMCKTLFEHLPHCPPSPKSADPHTRSAALLENLGLLESWKGNHQAGLAYLEQALSLYEKEGNNEGVASVLRKQAVAAFRDSDNRKALIAASAALEKYRSLRDDLGIADALYWIGYTAPSLADSVRNLEESVKIFRAKENKVGIAKCLERLADAYVSQKQAEKALSTAEEAVDIASSCGDRLGEARGLLILGVANIEIDDLDKAMSVFQGARNIAVNIGWEDGLSTCLRRLGTIKELQGIYNEAEELFRESIRIARSSGIRYKLAHAFFLLGDCLWAQDRFDEAIPILEESYSAHQNLGRGYESASAQTAALLARSKSALGHQEEALAWYDRAIAKYRKDEDEVHVSEYLAEKGDVLVEMKRCDEAALHFEASLIIDEELQEEDGVEWNREKLCSIPKTVIKGEVWRRARLALARVHFSQTASLLCDVNKLQRRVPQLTTPNLKLQIKPVNGSDL